MKKRAIEIRVVSTAMLGSGFSPDTLDRDYAAPMCLAIDSIESVEPIKYGYAVAWEKCVEKPTFGPPREYDRATQYETRTFVEIRTKTGGDYLIIRGPSFEEIAALMRDPS